MKAIALFLAASGKIPKPPCKPEPAIDPTKAFRPEVPGNIPGA